MVDKRGCGAENAECGGNSVLATASEVEIACILYSFAASSHTLQMSIGCKCIHKNFMTLFKESHFNADFHWNLFYGWSAYLVDDFVRV